MQTLEVLSRKLVTAGQKHIIVLATQGVNILGVWKKIAAIFGHKPSIQIIDEEARGGHRLRVTFKNGVIDYGIWTNNIQVVDGMINSGCVQSVADRALKLIEAEHEKITKINDKNAHGAFHNEHRMAVAAIPTKITQKQLSGFKSAMTKHWSANDAWNKMTFGIDSPTYYLLKDLADQLGGSNGWRDLKLSEVNKALDGQKVQLTYYVPSPHVKSLFATAAFQKKSAVETPDGWDTALDKFIDGVQKIEDKYITENDYKHLKGTKVTFEDAVKFTKVYLNEPSGNKRIYCFIDRTNGDVLKPATYSVPAKGARGNLFDSDHGLKRMGPHGPAYNK